MKDQIICYLPMLYPAKIGGVEVYNYHLADNIQKYDFEHTYIFCTNKEALKGQENSFLCFNDKLFGIRRYGLGGISMFLSILFSIKIRLRNVNTIYTSYVSSTSTADVILLLLLNYFFSINIVLHIHGGGMKPWNPEWLHKHLFKKAYSILGVSEKICTEYTRRSNRQVELSLPIVPFEKVSGTKFEIKKQLGFCDFDTIILYVGSLKDLKSPQTLLNAFIDLPENWVSKNNVALIYCGDGPLRKPLEKIAKESLYSNRIFFMGNVKNSEVCNYYAIADIYAITSWFEGTPISLLQAFHNNVLSFGSNVNGIKDIIKDGHNGFLFENEDSEGLCKLLNKYPDDINIDLVTSNAKKDLDNNFNYRTTIIKLITKL